MIDMPCLYISSEHFKKIGEREPVFVLRAQDVVAPDAIETWIALAQAAGAPQEKLDHARLHAQAMRDWGGRKKVPD